MTSELLTTVRETLNRQRTVDSLIEAGEWKALALLACTNLFVLRPDYLVGTDEGYRLHVNLAPMVQDMLGILQPAYIVQKGVELGLYRSARMKGAKPHGWLIYITPPPEVLALANEFRERQFVASLVFASHSIIPFSEEPLSVEESRAYAREWIANVRKGSGGERFLRVLRAQLDQTLKP